MRAARTVGVGKAERVVEVDGRVAVAVELGFGIGKSVQRQRSDDRHERMRLRDHLASTAIN